MTFYPLLEQHRLYNGFIKSFDVAEVSLLLVHQNNENFVLENRCPHQDAPLDYATLKQGVIRCPLHGMEFCLRDGSGIGPGVCTGGIKVYETAVIDGFVGVYL